jgi:hypothetical protein
VIEIKHQYTIEDAAIAYDNAADSGYEEAESWSAPLGATMAGQQVAIGAMRFAFDTDGAEGLKRLMEELQEAAREWTK